MRRLVPPDKAVVETGIPRPGGGESVYRMRKDGTIHVPDSDVRALKQAGYSEPSSGGFCNAPGFICTQCGFHGFFRKCGRCGCTDTVRPSDVDL